MVMNALRHGVSGGITKFFLFGFMVLAVGGLVFTDIGGFFRGGVSSTDIAKIGQQTLSAQQFDNLVRRTTSQVGISPQQAFKMGFVTELLSNQIRAALVQEEAKDLGVSIGTAAIAAHVEKILAPMAQPGQSPQDVLKQFLMSQRTTEAALASELRREMSIDIIRDTIKGGFAESAPAMIDDMARFGAEERSIEYITFPDKDYTQTPGPNAEDLQQFYQMSKENYAKPELREGQLLIIKLDKLTEAMTVSDEELKDLYEQNIERYSQPEKRTIEQAMISDDSQAAEITALVQDGKSLESAVKSVTGNVTDYLPPRDVSDNEVLENLKEPVFAAAKGEVIGPVETAIGQQIIVVKDIIPAQIQKFEAVKDALKKETLEGRLLDAQFELANNVDDLLASGALLDEVQEQIDLEISPLPPINNAGLTEDGKDGLKELDTDARSVLQALYELNEGEASPVFEFKDGRMGAVLLKTVTPKTYKPFEDVKAEIEKRWISDHRRIENKMAALEILGDVQAKGTGFKTMAARENKPVQRLSGVKRMDEPKDSFTPGAMATIFEVEPGTPFILDLEDGAGIAVVTDVKIPDQIDDKILEKTKTAMRNTMQDESYSLYIQHLNKRYGASVNDRLLRQLYDQDDE